MSFDVSAVAYLRFMGRYWEPLAVRFADLAGVRRGSGCWMWAAGLARSPLELDPAADDESGLAGVREGHLARLFTQAGLARVQVTALTVRVRHASFEEWWEPFTLAVGPAGAYVASLAPGRREALRGQCQRQLPAGPVEISATACAATGRA